MTTFKQYLGSLLIALACAPLAALAADGKDVATPILTEWPVPWENTRPRDPYVGPGGLVWFVGQRGDYVARLDPEDGAFKQLPLDDGTGPHNLIVDEDGTIWYAGNRAAHIGKMDPQSGEMKPWNSLMYPRRGRGPTVSKSMAIRCGWHCLAPTSLHALMPKQ